MRTRARVDGNHGAIVDALRKHGIAVQSLAPLGKGVPDLLCCFRGVNTLLEVKAPGEKPNAMQREWMESWPSEVYVVETAEDAVVRCVEAARPRREA